MLQHCIIPNTKGLSYVLTFLSWMHVFEWHMAGLYLKMDNKKALVTNKKNKTHFGSIVSSSGRAYVST